MRVLVGNPGAGTLEIAELPSDEAGFMAATRAHVGAHYLEAMPLLGGERREVSPAHMVWLAEEGLFSATTGFWKHKWSPVVYAGPFVITGFEDGAEKPATVTIDDVAASIEMYGARVTINSDTPRDDVNGMIEAVIRRTL